jgi:hypothetical protein
VVREKPKSELLRLFKEQTKTLEEEVFGGLSPAERAQYDRKTRRINELEMDLAASAVAKTSQPGKAERKSQWSKEAETDMPQGEARQPYRSREKDATNTSTHSRKKRRKSKGRNAVDEKRSE